MNLLNDVLAQQLKSRLKAYIEDIDTEDFTRSIFSGKICLNNVKLNRDLFADSPLPFQLEYGQVGKINIQVPFWDMFTSPLVIKIENVFGIVKMKPMYKWDTDKQVQAFQQSNKYLLEQVELYFQQKELLEESEKEHKAQKNKLSYVETLVSKILNNLQIKIKNVYFRFEDQMTGFQEQKFALGLKLHEFSVFTSNKNYEKIRIEMKQELDAQKSLPVTHKVAEILGFSFFCDWEDVDLQENGGIDEEKLWNFVGKLNKEAFVKSGQLGAQSYYEEIINQEFKITDANNQWKHKYLIQNFNVKLELQVQNQLLIDDQNRYNAPIVKAKILIGGFNNKYSDQNLDPCYYLYQPQILRILKSLEIIGYYNKFKESALKQFYDFRLSEEEQNQYIETYIQLKKLQSLQKKDKRSIAKLQAQLELIEQQASTDIIIDLRNFGTFKYKQQKRQLKEQEYFEKKIREEVRHEQGWGVQSLFKKTKDYRQLDIQFREKYVESIASIKQIWRPLNEKLDSNTSQLVALYKKSPELFCKDLLQQIDLQSGEKNQDQEGKRNIFDPNNYPPLYLQYDFQLDIPQLQFKIENEFKQLILIIKLKQFNVNYLLKKGQQVLFLSLEDWEIVDKWSTDLGNSLKLMETSEQTEFGIQEENKKLALSINYESNESFKECPYHVKVNVDRPLQINLLITLVNELLRTLNASTQDQKMDFNFYKEKAIEQFRAKKVEFQNTQNQIKKGEYTHTSVSLDVRVQAPVIKIYQNSLDVTSPYLQLNFGTITCNSALIPYDQKANKYEQIEDEQLLYDKYTIQIKKINVSFVRPNVHNRQQNQIYDIIKEIDFDINIENCLAPLHNLFPTYRIGFQFGQDIVFEIDIDLIQQIFELKDDILIQLDQSDIDNLHKFLQRRYFDQEKLSQAFSQDSQELIRLKMQNDIASQLCEKKRKKDRKLINQTANGGRVPLNLLQKKQLDPEQSLIMDGSSSIRDEEVEQRDHSEGRGTNLEVNMQLKLLKFRLKDKELQNQNIFRQAEYPEGEYDSDTVRESQRSENEDEQCKRQIHQQNSVLFELAGFQSKLRLDNNYLDTIINLSIQSLLIKEGPDCDDNDDDRKKIQMFNYIISSSDLEFQNYQNFNREVAQSQKTVNQEVSFQNQIEEGKQKEDQLSGDQNQEGISFKSFESIRVNDVRIEAQKLNENQFELQCIIKTKTYQDQFLNEEVSKSDMEIYCIINQSRVLLNIQTMHKVLVVKNNLMDLLAKGEYDHNERRIDQKRKFLTSVASPVSDDEIQSDFNQVLRRLQKKIFYNLAKNS